MRNGSRHSVMAMKSIFDEGEEVARVGDRGNVVVAPSAHCPYPTVWFARTGRATMVDPDEITAVPVQFGFVSAGELLS